MPRRDRSFADKKYIRQGWKSLKSRDLYGAGHVNLLRYDFGVYDKTGKLKCLIECQGEQHYEPVEEFGGNSQFTWQQRNDAPKRGYAEENGIPLYEIPYKNKRFEKV